MTDLNSENFFFFSSDVSDLQIEPSSLEHAYLAILDDDLESAKKIFENNDSPRAVWGKILVSVLQGFMTEYPTYFQIRNFLEIDLDFLLKNNKIGYVEQFLGASDIFANINQETYKFLARVMINNKLNTAAVKYMDKSKKLYYNDPELHFMYAKFYMDNGRYNDAYFYINECLRLLPDYYPAKILKERIEEIDI